jgi:hypothetical protein
LAGKGGLVWVKNRNDAGGTYHILEDTARGANKVLYSDTTDAQFNYPNRITAFTSGGFTVGLDSDVNGSSKTYASWTFREAAKFFDVVTYTGTGSARTIAHSLGVAPGMVIVKRTDTTGNWQVYHRSLTSAAYSMQLNLTAAQASAPTVWNSTAPTSSVFSVGTDATVNASGGTYVAYLYAHDTSSTGIIQCGSYTGNGTTAGPLVNLGWEPQYIMIKTLIAGGGWLIFDSMRGLTVASSNDAWLEANSAAAESTYTMLQPTATGFQAGNSGTGLNDSGTTYIYMAIRRPNKPPTTGTQVYNAISRTGTGVNTTISSVGFAPDAVFVKAKQDQSTWMNNKLVGQTKWLTANATGADITDSNVNSLTSYLNTGISVGTDSSLGCINYDTSKDYINWFFKRAPGFFDIVCWTGVAGATNQRVNHNLGVVPEFIIYKGRNKVNYWRVYYGNINQYIPLHLNYAAYTGSNFWGTSLPTVTDFGINCGSMDLDNFNAVAYLFATLAGISKVGSYTGNGGTQAINCGFTAGARFVLVKATSATGDWFIWDTARGINAANEPHLSLNTTAAEVTTDDTIDYDTNGFVVNQVAATSVNASGVSYIFLAIS